MTTPRRPRLWTHNVVSDADTGEQIVRPRPDDETPVDLVEVGRPNAPRADRVAPFRRPNAPASAATAADLDEPHH